MKEQRSDSSQIVGRILEEEGLPRDLLQRASHLPETGDKKLFEWVMKLREVLTEEQERVVGDVLNDGVLVSTAGSSAIARQAATLTGAVQSVLKSQINQESSLMGQATYVLALDVQNRVHNETNS